MSIIIQGIEMPKSCIDCPCHDGEWGCCNITKNYIGFEDSRPQDCPLKEAEPIVHAHWIDKTEDTRREYVCSKCERSVFLQFSHAIKEEPALLQVMYPYCHCGARMDEEVEK